MIANAARRNDPNHVGNACRRHQDGKETRPNTNFEGVPRCNEQEYLPNGTARFTDALACVPFQIFEALGHG